MASGPPASAAESSKMAGQTAETVSGPHQPGNSTTSTMTRPHTANQNPYASLATPMNPAQAYQAYAHMNWQGSWPMNSIYTGGASVVPPTSHYSQHTYAPYQTHYYPIPVQPTPGTPTQMTTPVAPLQNAAGKMEVDDKPQSPPPPPKYEHWDEAIREFLQEAGLTQALRGFECDMLVMNSEWERTRVRFALERLMKGLSTTRELRSPKGKEKETEDQDGDDRHMEDRKRDYVNLANGEQPRTPTAINKEISAFLARNRARNDASNRTEFLLSLSEKRKRLQELSDVPEDGVIPSCARTDARTIDRDAQMKYDIAKNDDGPLRRTKAKKDQEQQLPPKQSTNAEPSISASGIAVPNDQEALPKHHPGADERLYNIESHLAVRYVPSPPRTLWARLKFLEDHIIKLEKDYPPWAALHFNQPNRGWPPPPRATPIIVPPHLRSSDPEVSSAIKTNTPGSQPGNQSSSSTASMLAGGNQKTRNPKSSLQRAVMERLEVQQAMGEQANFGS